MHLLTEADFGSAVRFTQAHLPRSIVVHHWLLLRDQEDVSSVQHTSSNSLCYADRWPNPTALFVIDFCKFASHERYPFAAFFSSQLEKPGGVLEFLEAVEAKHGFTENNGFVLGSLPVEWLPVFKAVFERGEFTFDKWSQLKLFHLPESHRPSLHQAVADLQLDEQFCLDTLRVEDAQLVNDCWPHRFEGSLALIEKRISRYPNVCIRRRHDLKLAAFVLCDSEYAFLTHLWVFPEFRRLGLATKLEMVIAHKLFNIGFIPYKHIVQTNQPAIIMTKKSPFWKNAGFLVNWLHLKQQV